MNDNMKYIALLEKQIKQLKRNKIAIQVAISVILANILLQIYSLFA